MSRRGGWRDLNPHVQVDAHAVALTPDNARDLIAGHDLVLDGTDDFVTRFAVNAACVAEAQAAGLRRAGPLDRAGRRVRGASLLPLPRARRAAGRGDLRGGRRRGGARGGVGSMMALEAIKRLMGAGDPLSGRLLVYDGLAGESRTVRVGADPACPVCGVRAPAP